MSTSTANAEAVASPRLKRSLGLVALTIYGVGDILGAGIYALVGEVTGAAGIWSWLSFLVSMSVAGMTAFAYCELVTRFPRSGGESTFALHAFRKSWVAFLIGWMVFCSGVFSMSSVTHACANYVQGLLPGTPAWPLWILFLAAIAALNFRGMRESSLANIAFTLIEFSGLLLIILVGASVWLSGDAVVPTALDQPVVEATEFSGIATGVLSGAAIAFFAFVGFEDMINVAEEVREPERIFPKAILLAVSICGTIYILVALASLAVLPPQELADAEAPLLAVVQQAAPWVPPWLYTVVALIAVSNTGLLNSIMASRLIYGMSTHGLLPRWFDRVHESTQTPHRAVLVIFVVGLLLVFSGTLSHLAATTSFLLLLVFVVVNVSLIRLRTRPPDEDSGDSTRPTSDTACFRTPLVIPALASLLCLGLLVFVETFALLTGLGVIAVGLIFALLASRRGIDWEELAGD